MQSLYKKKGYAWLPVAVNNGKRAYRCISMKCNELTSWLNLVNFA